MKPNAKNWLKSGFMAVLLLAVGFVACISLTPIRAVYRVDLMPIAAAGAYQLDPADDGAVFVKEGLRLKVRHLGDRELNAQYPDASNPFTYRGEVDPKLGHVPPQLVGTAGHWHQAELADVGFATHHAKACVSILPVDASAKRTLGPNSSKKK